MSESTESVESDVYTTGLDFSTHEGRVQSRVLASMAFPESASIIIKDASGQTLDQVKGYRFEDSDASAPSIAETVAPPTTEEVIARLNQKVDSLLEVKEENRKLRKQNATLRVAYHRLGGDVSKLLKEEGSEP